LGTCADHVTVQVVIKRADPDSGMTSVNADTQVTWVGHPAESRRFGIDLIAWMSGLLIDGKDGVATLPDVSGEGVRMIRSVEMRF